MGVLRVDGLTKAFGIETLFSDVSFELRRGDKVGLIGANGTGKTTLLRCLLGFQRADSGQVSLSSGETIGYVEQDAGTGEHTFYQELASAYSDVLGWQADMRHLETAIAAEKNEAAQAELLNEYAKIVDRFERGGGYEYENNIRRVAFGLGFTDADFERTLDSFSGGQKTRISLARALLRQPDFLFLDEPTNHLDVGMVEWLEDFLKGYPGGVLIISHDRYFLDKVVGRILELENGKLVAYNGNYSQYLVQKEERLAALTSAYEKQQTFIAKTQEFIDRYRAGVKSKQARGREKRLARLERIVLPPEISRFDFFGFNPPTECAERVAELDKATAAYGEKVIFKDLSMLIRRGDGVALVGPNGAGKTTLLKLLTGDLEPVAGRVKIGSRVKIGYFSQEHEGLNPKNRILDELNQEFGLSEERSRHYLGAFLFQGDDVYKIIGDLSGGEKARLAMLKLMLTGANFLILDEPTNHLDIPAKEAVEEAIMSFPGTFLAVSHDRYFLDKVANCVVELDNGQLVEYVGNYSYYREKKLAEEKAAAAEKAANQSAVAEKKAAQPRQRKQDNERQLKKLEAEIAGLEAAISAMEVKLGDPAVHADPTESKALADEYAQLQADLEAKYDEWMERTGD
ncbi:MAG: ABC-F family ATP-binding cassette domain-containing protein [Negativicutes bacterium]|jgi:ATP-binding cassette subfamily F protein 3